MRQSDLFTIIIVASVGTLAAYFALNAILGDPNMQTVSFKTIQPIQASLETPDSELFNPDAINPTVEVFVGSCDDVDQNGILSVEEMKECGKITAEEAEKAEIYYCQDGTPVLNKKECPEVREEELQKNNVENTEGQ